MTKVRINNQAPSHGFGYGEGVHDVPKKLADKMIERGVAEPLEAEKAVANTLVTKKKGKK